MKKFSIGLLFALVLAACAHVVHLPGPPMVIVTVYAQAPVTKTLAWTAGANADSYRAALDTNVFANNVVGTSTPITIGSNGMHTIVVTSVNVWGTAASMPLGINVVPPGAPAGLSLTFLFLDAAPYTPRPS